MITFKVRVGEESEPLSEDLEADVTEPLLLSAQVESLVDDLSPSWVLLDDFGRPIVSREEARNLVHLSSDTELVNCVLVRNTDEFDGVCTRRLFGDFALLQPTVMLEGTDFKICSSCAQVCFSGDWVKPCPSVPLQAFICQSEQAIEFGLGLSPHNPAIQQVLDPFSRTGLYIRRQLLQQATAILPLTISNNEEHERGMVSALRSGCQTVNAYEDPQLQADARTRVDTSKLQQYVDEVRSTNEPEDVCFITGLLRWFKHDFFRWTNKPKCSNCDAAPNQMQPAGMTGPNEEEQRGWAGRVELYKCQDCSVITRFPRYNNPAKLLDSRTGRCGEWANCFTLICRSFGLDARWVRDWTDHVWTEIWISSMGRFVHADPCEKRLDAPLLYEKGWNKKLSYVVSFSRYGVVDSTARYSRKMHEVYERRTEVTERFLASSISQLDLVQLTTFSQRQLLLSDITLEQATARKQSENWELSGMCLQNMEREAKAEEKQGRITGDEEWKRSRGEIGSGGLDDSSSVAAEYNPTTLVASSQCDTSGRLHWLVPNLMTSADMRQADVMVVSCVHDRPNSTLHIRTLDPWDCIVNKEPGIYSNDNVIVNGVGVCRGGRGHNLVSLNTWTGCSVYDSVSFDTWGDPAAGAKLCGHLQRLNDGESLHAQNTICENSSPPTNALMILTVIDNGERVASSERAAQLLFEATQPYGGGSVTTTDLSLAGGESWIMIGFKPETLSYPTVVLKGRTREPILRRLIFRNPTDRVTSFQITCKRVENSVCKMALSFLPDSVAPLESQQLASDDLFDKASEYCLACTDVLGFTHVPRVGVYIFSKGAYPLRHLQGATTFVKIVNTSLVDIPPSVQANVGLDVQYLRIGGSRHPDTRAWDCSSEVLAMVKVISEVHGESKDTFFRMVHALRTPTVSVKCGSLVVGLQVGYAIGRSEWQGAMHQGSEIAEARTIRLQDEEHVSSVSIHAGALVDSVHIETSLGKRHSFGGEGGEGPHTVAIPEGYVFIGFFGGVGGHLHHLGLVVVRVWGTTTDAEDDSELIHDCFVRPLCPQACNSDNSVVPALSLADLVSLHAEFSLQSFAADSASALRKLWKCNPHSKCVQALEALERYVSNLASATPAQWSKVTSIKTTNAFYLAIGGLQGGHALLSAALPRWQLSASGTHMEAYLPSRSDNSFVIAMQYVRNYSHLLAQLIARLK